MATRTEVQQAARDTIEDATANIRYYRDKITHEEARLFDAKLASGLYVVNGKGDLVRVEVAS